MKQKCEWCGEEASYRFTSGKRVDYERFACRDVDHKKKVTYLMDMDLGGSRDLRKIEVCVNGFEVSDAPR